MGDPVGAEKQLREALRLTPDDPDVLNALGTFLCVEKDDVRGGMKYFDRALEAPLYNHREVLYINAARCIQPSDSKRAEEYLRGALIVDPQSTTALYFLAQVAYENDSNLQARAYMQRRLKLAAPTAPVLALSVLIEEALGDEAAVEKYEKQLMTSFPASQETRDLLSRRRTNGN
jgi:type IV pilus assembly protein PilF